MRFPPSGCWGSTSYQFFSHFGWALYSWSFQETFRRRLYGYEWTNGLITLKMTAGRFDTSRTNYPTTQRKNPDLLPECKSRFATKKKSFSPVSFPVGNAASFPRDVSRILSALSLFFSRRFAVLWAASLDRGCLVSHCEVWQEVFRKPNL